MHTPYTGNSPYCYANSLHMCLSSAHAEGLPEPGFLECMTIMPFGACYLNDGSAHLWFPSPASIHPDTGLDIAIKNMGWSCESWHGEASGKGSEGDQALEQLQQGLQKGPVLLGPLDMGYLTYDPNCSRKVGTDHFVVALRIEADQVLVHDPQGFPFATLSTDDLISSWCAEKIGYNEHPYKMRHRFRQIEKMNRKEMITCTLPVIREQAVIDPGGPHWYGSLSAFRLVAQVFRDKVPDSLAGMMNFTLPLGARRCLDGARFLQEGELNEAAEYSLHKAFLYGQCQHLAVNEQWSKVADTIDEIAELESKLISAY